jgi:hypothetical protein
VSQKSVTFCPDTARPVSLEPTIAELLKQSVNRVGPAFAAAMIERRQELERQLCRTREDELHVLGYLALRESRQRFPTENQSAARPEPAPLELDAIEPHILERERRAIEAARLVLVR